MKTFRFSREQIIPQSIDAVFDYFSDARNLETLTPPWLHFQILTPGTIDMHVGTMIQYSLRVHGIPINWTTAITDWNPPHEFIDVQLRGPYTLWHHSHKFESLGEETRMTDVVTYAIPAGWLGIIMYHLMIKRDLYSIFQFRQEIIERVFTQSRSSNS